MDSVTITHAVFSNVYYKSKKVSPLFTKTKKSACVCQNRQEVKYGQPNGKIQRKETMEKDTLVPFLHAHIHYALL